MPSLLRALSIAAVLALAIPAFAGPGWAIEPPSPTPSLRPVIAWGIAGAMVSAYLLPAPTATGLVAATALETLLTARTLVFGLGGAAVGYALQWP